MENLSLNLLGKSNNNSNSNSNNEFNLYSLSPVKKQISVQDKINEMVENKKKKRELLLFEYDKLLTKCIDKIGIADNLGQTELCFDIPYAIKNLSIYKPIDCLNFIQNKLRELGIDTLKINSTSIVISWLYIEVNRT